MKNKWLLLLYDRGKFSSTIYHLLSKSFLQICKVSSYYFRSSRLNYSPSNLGNGEATKMDQEQRQMRPEAEIGTTFLARHCFHSTDFGGKITTKRRKGIQTFFTRQNLPQQQWRHQRRRPKRTRRRRTKRRQCWRQQRPTSRLHTSSTISQICSQAFSTCQRWRRRFKRQRRQRRTFYQKWRHHLPPFTSQNRRRKFSHFPVDLISLLPASFILQSQRLV